MSNVLISGETLANTVSSLIDQINRGVQLSLSSTVDALHHSQASRAVAAGVRAFREQLPEGVRRVGTGDSTLNAAAIALSPSAVAFRLRNATEAAISVFAEHAPIMGSHQRLQPYVEQLRTSLQAMQREIEQVHTHSCSCAHSSHASHIPCEVLCDSSRPVMQLESLIKARCGVAGP